MNSTGAIGRILPIPRACGGSSACDVWLNETASSFCGRGFTIGDNDSLLKGFGGLRSFWVSPDPWEFLVETNHKTDDMMNATNIEESVMIFTGSFAHWGVLLAVLILWMVAACITCYAVDGGCCRCCINRARSSPFQAVRKQKMLVAFWTSTICLGLYSIFAILAIIFVFKTESMLQDASCSIYGSSSALMLGGESIKEPWPGLEEMPYTLSYLYDQYVESNGTIALGMRLSTTDFTEDMEFGSGRIRDILDEMIERSADPTREAFTVVRPPGGSDDDSPDVSVLHTCLICEGLVKNVDLENVRSSVEDLHVDLDTLESDVYQETGPGSSLADIAGALKSAFESFNSLNPHQIYNVLDSLKPVIETGEPYYQQAMGIIAIVLCIALVIGTFSAWVTYTAMVWHYNMGTEPPAALSAKVFSKLMVYFGCSGVLFFLIALLVLPLAQTTMVVCEPIDSDVLSGSGYKSWPGMDANMTRMIGECVNVGGKGDMSAAFGMDESWDEAKDAQEEMLTNVNEEIDAIRETEFFEDPDVIRALAKSSWVYLVDFEVAQAVHLNYVVCFGQALFGGVTSATYEFPEIIRQEFGDEINQELADLREAISTSLPEELDKNLILAEIPNTVDDWPLIFGLQDIGTRLGTIAAYAGCPAAAQTWCLCPLPGAEAGCDAIVQAGSLAVLSPGVELFDAAQLVYDCLLAKDTAESLSYAAMFAAGIFYSKQKCRIRRGFEDGSTIFFIDEKPSTFDEFSPYTGPDAPKEEWGYIERNVDDMLNIEAAFPSTLDVYNVAVNASLNDMLDHFEDELLIPYNCKAIYRVTNEMIGSVCWDVIGEFGLIAVFFLVLAIFSVVGWILCWKLFHYWSDRSDPGIMCKTENPFEVGDVHEPPSKERNVQFDAPMFF